jgi:hypothetical protein
VSNAAAVISVVFVQTLAGLGALAAIGRVWTVRDLARNLALAPLAGMAWAGVVAATLATFGSRLSAVGLGALTLVTCVAGAVSMRRRSSTPDARERTHATPSWLERAAVAETLVPLAAVIVAAAAFFRVKPLAEYDGWAMWGMKSRAIAVLGAADPDVFASAAYSRLHLQYPLLLPSLHAVPLQLQGGFSSNTVVLSCFANGLAGLAAMWGLLRDRVRASILVPFVAVLATAPAFFGQLATGYGRPGRDLRRPRHRRVGTLAARRRAGVARAHDALRRGGDTHQGRRRALRRCDLRCTLHRSRGASSSHRALGSGRGLMYAPWRANVAINDLGAPPYDLSSSFNTPWIVGRLDRIPTPRMVSSAVSWTHSS